MRKVVFHPLLLITLSINLQHDGSRDTHQAGGIVYIMLTMWTSYHELTRKTQWSNITLDMEGNSNSYLPRVFSSVYIFSTHFQCRWTPWKSQLICSNCRSSIGSLLQFRAIRFGLYSFVSRPRTTTKLCPLMNTAWYFCSLLLIRIPSNSNAD